MSHESVLSAGGACTFLAPRPLTPPFEAALLRVVAAAPEGVDFGRRIPNAPKINLEPLEASAGGRPGRANSTRVRVAVEARGVPNKQREQRWKKNSRVRFAFGLFLVL